MDPSFFTADEIGVSVRTRSGTKFYRPYQYEPIAAKNGIRLIRPYTSSTLKRIRNPFLASTSGCDPFQKFEIIQADLDQYPKYYAVSYTWGDTSQPRSPIFLKGGFALMITTSAWQALHALGREKYLWIDQITINQADHDEKCSQVRKMTAVYSLAVKCLVWLGKDNVGGPPASAAFDLAKCIVDVPSKLPALRNGKLFGSTRAQIRQMLSQEYESFFLPSEHDPGWKAMESLLSRPWYSRLWTFQEAVIAREIVVCCGHVSCNFDAFIGAALARSNMTECTAFWAYQNHITQAISRSTIRSRQHIFTPTQRNVLLCTRDRWTSFNTSRSGRTC